MSKIEQFQTATICLTTTEDEYAAALFMALKQSFNTSIPLLSTELSRYASYLQYLNFSATRYISDGNSYSVSSQMLWDAYAALFGKEISFPATNTFQLSLWYREQNINSEHIVILLDNNLFYPALLYAAFHHYPILPLETIAGITTAIDILHPSYMTIVSSANIISHHVLEHLHLLLQKYTLARPISLGFLTGRDLAAVTWMALKLTVITHFLPIEQCIIAWLPWRDNSFVSEINRDNHIKAYGPQDTFRQVIGPLLEQQAPEHLPDLLLIESHGFENNIYFSDGALCGAAFPGSQGEKGLVRSQATPPCTYGQPCVRQDAVPIHEVRVKHVFTNSCNSARIGQATYPYQYNLALNVLDGLAFSYIGAYSDNESRDYEIFLYIAALRAGMAVGDAVHLLNTIRGNFLPVCKLLLLGNPQAHIVQPEKCIYHTSVKQIQTSQWVIEADVTTTPLIRVNIEIDTDVNHQELYYITSETNCNVPDPCYFSVETQERRVIVHLYTCGSGFSQGRYTFQLAPLPAVIARAQEQTQSFLDACHLTLSTQLLPEKLLLLPLTQIKDVSQQLAGSLSDLAIRGSLIIQAIPKLEHMAFTLVEQVQLADHLILHFLLRHHGAGLRAYQRRVKSCFYATSSERKNVLCLCGNHFSVQPMKHALLEHTILNHYCPICGWIYSSTRHGVTACFLSISTPIDGQSWQIVVKFENETDRTITGYTGAVIFLNANQFQQNDSQSKLHIACTPQDAFLSLPAQAAATQTFTIETQNFTTNAYGLCVCFVSNGGISFLQRDIYLTRLPEEESYS